MLVAATELGDRKPSELLREMQRLAQRLMGNSVIQTLWLQKLPLRIQEFFSFIKDTPLAKMAKYANKAYAKHKSALGSVASVATPTEVKHQDSVSSELTTQLTKLTGLLSDLASRLSTTPRRPRSRSRLGSRAAAGRRYSARSRSPSVGNGKTARNTNDGNSVSDDYCWYHATYGAKA